jgi:putative flippase GtrA
MLGPFLASRRRNALITKYAVFAGISIGSNLGSQWVTGAIYDGPFRVYAMLAVGTGIGLVVKNLLDKRYIFFFEAHNVGHDAWTFLRYVAMGVITTAIFWGSELLFHTVFTDPKMLYVGGLVGLLIGYTTKFFLDRKWVFG